jgi:hypothetical protein
MKKLYLSLWIAGLLFVGGWAADQQANFSGTWRLDTKLSDSAPKYSRSAAAYGAGEPWSGWGLDTTSVGEPGSGIGRYKILVIQQTENELQITYKGANINYLQLKSRLPIKSNNANLKELLAKAAALELNQDLVEIVKLDKDKVRMSKQKLTVETETKTQRLPPGASYTGESWPSDIATKEFSLNKDGKIMKLRIISIKGSQKITENLVYHLE